MRQVPADALLSLLLITHVLRPRFFIAAPTVLPIISAYLAGFALLDSDVAALYAPEDFAFIAFLAVAFAAVLLLDLSLHEGQQRAHLLLLMKKQEGRKFLDAHELLLKKMLATVIPDVLTEANSAERLLTTQQHFTAASGTVSVTDVHNFGQWSSQLLAAEVIEALQAMTTLFGCKQFDIACFTSYGDSFVACANIFGRKGIAKGGLSNADAGRKTADEEEEEDEHHKERVK